MSNPELNHPYKLKELASFFNEKSPKGNYIRIKLNAWNRIWNIEKRNGYYIIKSFSPKYPPQNKYKLNIGDKFNKLTIIAPINSDKKYDYKYLCQCECGNQTIVNAYSLIYGNTQSCGCIHRTTGKYIGKYKQSEDILKERSKLTPSLRFSILKRDNYHCRICGRGVEDNVKLEIDHIIPVSKGGLTEENNLWVLCQDCNRGKRDNEI